jgi:hypothetical protein
VTWAAPLAADATRAPRLRCAPNPFGAATVVRFDLDRPASVDLSVFDVRGRRVAVIERGWRDAGTRTVPWAADGLAAGVYFLRLTGAGEPAVRVISIVR